MSSAQVGAMLRHIRKLAPVPPDHELPDYRLLERFALDRDEAAFAALLRRHGPMVLSVCRGVLHDAHDAEDAFQAAFLLLAQKAGSLQRREAVSGWLYRVAYHTALRARANAARRKVLEKRAVAMPSADPVLEMNLRELRAVLFEELEGLPEKQRAPLVLCGLEEKSLEEAARLLGWTKGAVKGRLQRGRELLRVRLRRRGLELPAALSATALALGSSSSRVSAGLAESTLRAAVQVMAGGVVAGTVSTQVANLVLGASQSTFTTKAQIATALVLAVSISATAFGVMRHRAPAADEPAAAQSQAQRPPSQNDRPPPAAQPKPEVEKDREVRGQVLGPEGHPVSGAKVYLASSGTEEQTVPEKATSGPDGRFRFTVSSSTLDKSAAPRSGAQVMAVAEGYGCDWVKVGAADEDLILRLVKDEPINGRILDPDGKPVVGAKVTVKGVSAANDENLGAYLTEARQGYGYAFAKYWEGPLPGRPAAFTTDADGRFRLTGAGRERLVHFRVEGPAIAYSYLGPVMTRPVATIVDPKGRHIYGASFDYVAFASRPIRGVVRDKESGKPLAGVSIGHYHNNPPKTVTDKEGRYELLGLAKARQYMLDVRPADGLYFHRRVRLPDAPGLDALTADIELTRGLTVRGRVTDKATGKPIAGARIEYHPLGGNTYANQLDNVSKPCAETTTGPDGRYLITVLPGPGAIGVISPRQDAYMPAWVSLPERQHFFKTPLVDDNGEDFLTVAGGANSFGAIGQNSYHALVLIEPGEKEERLVKDAALERPQERKGRVVGPDGQSLTGVTVIGLSPYFPGDSTAERLAGDEFIIRGVNPRAQRRLVFCHKDKKLGFYLKDLRAEAPGRVTVRLQPCGSISGRVVDQDGRPVTGMRLHVPGMALHSTGDGQWVTTDREGRFRAEGLVAGQVYWVWDASGSFPRVFAKVEVEPGQHKDMGDITMTERRQ